MAHPRLTRMLLAAGTTLLASAALAGCSDAALDDAEPESRGFALAGQRLTIAKDTGDLDVQPADVDEVEVTRWFAAGSAVGGNPHADWDFAGDRLTLTTSCGFISTCAVRYEVRVPPNVAVTVQGQNGQISASGFDTALEVSTENGAIVLSDLAGDLDLKSENGQLRATGLSSGQVAAVSSNGEVQLSFEDVPDQVAVATDNGAVTVAVPDATYRVTTSTDSGEVRVDVPESPHSPHTITAQTANGAITLRIAE